ncbi:hypothetical protein BS78_05G185200 [Paspalum vaginatum]|nr:hypothetical protein BS78_05G185200 [Paspalum vaginatum]
MQQVPVLLGVGPQQLRVDTNCYYTINRNLPDEPFGTCAFAPQTCSCGDSNCTHPAWPALPHHAAPPASSTTPSRRPFSRP